MEIVEREHDFDIRQIALLREIAEAVKLELEQAGIGEDRLRSLTDKIAFSIAVIVDGDLVMECDGHPLTPVLTFRDGADPTKLIASVGGSWMHEYLFGITDQLFGEDTSV